MDAGAVGFSNEVGVEHLNHRLRVDVRDEGAGFNELTVGEFHACGLGVVTGDFRNFAIGSNLASELAYGVGQGGGDGVAAADDAPCTLDVKVVDQGVYVGRRFVFYTRIQREVAGQHVLQFRIAGDAPDEVVDACLDVVGFNEDVVFNFPQIVEWGSVCNGFQLLHVFDDFRMAVGKTCTERFHKLLVAGSVLVSFPRNGKNVVAGFVQPTEFHVIKEVQVAEQTVQDLSLQHAANVVHAGVEFDAETLECLQTSANLGILLQ